MNLYVETVVYQMCCALMSIKICQKYSTYMAKRSFRFLSNYPFKRTKINQNPNGSTKSKYVYKFRI